MRPRNIPHKYKYTVDLESNTAPANIAKMAGQNKSILEIGCGPGSITKILKEKNQCDIVGIEIDEEAINIAKYFCSEIIKADLNNKEWPILLGESRRFDVVVAADVLEHLYNPWQTLKIMSTLINSNGYILISLPHTAHAAISACLFKGTIDYKNWGLLDKTHIRFFGLKNIEDLIREADLKIVDYKYIRKTPEETEFALTWALLPSHVKKVLSEPPHSDIYQVVIKAIPKTKEGDAKNLLPPIKGRYKASILKTIKMLIALRLSQKSKDKIKSILKTLSRK